VVFFISAVQTSFDPEIVIQGNWEHLMTRRPTPKSLESLRVTLQKLEQTEDPDSGEHSISELKRVVLNRIADLELSKKLETADDEADNAPEPAALTSLPSITEEGAPEKELDLAPLDRFD
jgi:hypothetical protein